MCLLKRLFGGSSDDRLYRFYYRHDEEGDCIRSGLVNDCVATLLEQVATVSAWADAGFDWQRDGGPGATKLSQAQKDPPGRNIQCTHAMHDAMNAKIPSNSLNPS